MIDRAYAVALVAFAALVGLFEGPAEVACVLVILAAAAGGRLARARPGLAEIGLLVWALAGLPGLARGLAAGLHVSSEDALRPLLALAWIVGREGIGRADDRTLARLAWAFVAAVTVNAAYGYLQVKLGQLPLDRFLLKNTRSLQLYVPGHGPDRPAASGLFYNRLKLAHVGLVALGLTGLVALSKDPSLRRRVRVLAIAAGLVIAGAIALTYARMALVAFAGAAIILSIVLAEWRLVLGAIGVAGVASGAAIQLGLGRERLAAIGGDLDIRLGLFRTAFGLFRDHPALGVGHGLYKVMAAPSFDGRGALLDAHNLALQVLAETGVVGLCGFVLAIGLPLAELVRRVRRERAGTSARVLGDRFALFTLLALLILGLTHVPTHHATIALIFWCTAGIGARRRAERAEEDAPPAGRRSSRGTDALVAALALGCAGCPPEVVVSDPPDGIAWIAALALDDQGAVARASPLVRFDPARPPSFAFDRDEPHELIGFDDAALGTLSATVDETARLVPASGCAPTLPRPTWYARLVGETKLSLRPPAEAPGLTAPWIESACDLGARPSAVFDCDATVERCEVSMTAPCHFAISGCGGQDLVLRAGPSSACVEAPGPIVCAAPVDYAENGALACDVPIARPAETCRLSVYEAADRAPFLDPAESGGVVALAEVKPFIPERLDDRGELQVTAASKGYAFDVAILADVVAVSMVATATRAVDCYLDPVAAETKLAFYDRTTLALRGAVPTKPCLSNLERDPDGDGFLATYREGDVLSLGRFDAAGALVRSVALPPAYARARGTRLPDAEIFPARRAIAILAPLDGRSGVLVHDLGDLSARSATSAAVIAASFAAIDEHRLAMIGDPDGTRCELDLDDAMSPSCVSNRCLVREWIGFEYSLFDLVHDPLTGRDVISATERSPTLWICGEETRSVRFYERASSQPARIHRWPKDPRLIMSTSLSNDFGGRWTGVVNFLDPKRQQLLPGTWSLPGSLVGKIREDADGQLWLLFPWDALLVRLTPR